MLLKAFDFLPLTKREQTCDVNIILELFLVMVGKDGAATHITGNLPNLSIFYFMVATLSVPKAGKHIGLLEPIANGCTAIACFWVHWADSSHINDCMTAT